VLLIDDPFRFDDPDALAALVAVRNLAGSLQLQMEAAAAPFRAARQAFLRGRPWRRSSWPTRRRS